MGRDLSQLDIQFIKGVGPRKASLLRRLGIRTVRDALQYFPTRYEDRRNIGNIRDVTPGPLRTVTGKVVSAELLDLRRGGRRLFGPPRRGGLTLLELTVSDGSGSIKGKWFNQPYLKNTFKAGQGLILSGTVKTPKWGTVFEMENPDYEPFSPEGDEALVHTARIVPVYGATEGLSSRQVRTILFTVLKNHLPDVEDTVPGEILSRHHLPSLRESIGNTHFPEDQADPGELNRWASPWQRRLSFEEFFMLEAGFAIIRADKAREQGIAFRPTGVFVDRLRDSLPFTLTAAQEKTLRDIVRDMESPWPMNRLLQGDVGSGKTIVALIAMLSAVECGHQAVLMAPTEILAEQHCLTVHRLVEGLGLRMALLTGSTKKRPLDAIAGGEVHIVIGTHALIEEGVSFRSLGLAVIDEQHRFGVMQRARLRKKSMNPDVLIMTATPIPRTLSLTLYGDLDYSVLDELPPGRTPVMTSLYFNDRKQEVYRILEEAVKKGGQAYVVYPLIEGSEKTNLKSAMVGEEALRKKFPSLQVDLIHGRMKPADKEEVMGGFTAGEIDILVSTTVIEVGVDVPNASLMLIVHAERFGLAQLHQLRGRVGRGSRESRCLLLAYGPLTEDARRRLEVMCETTDGFRIAEEDLAIRGPGEFLGTRQAGMPDLRVANIVRDASVLEAARKEAFRMVDSDPKLEKHPLLRNELERFWRGKVDLFHTG
jgi:ATP-dependent DNA helicase RecG